MTDLSSFGFKLISGTQAHQHIKDSAPVYLNGFRVAWFQHVSRVSDGVIINTVSGDIVHRPELTTEQSEALRQWLSLQLLAAL